MSLIGPTKIVRDPSRPTGGDRLAVTEPPNRLFRVHQVAAALTAEALAGRAFAGRRPVRPVIRPADPTLLAARQAALAAALRQPSGATNGTLRTPALAFLAASPAHVGQTVHQRIGQEVGRKVGQEARRGQQGSREEAVFEAFLAGVEGRGTTQLVTGRGGQR